MTPAEIRAIVQALPITAAQLDAVMGAGIGSVSRWQTGAVTPTAPVLRLLRAYADGYRPTDWPSDAQPVTATPLLHRFGGGSLYRYDSRVWGESRLFDYTPPPTNKEPSHD
jgi:hypothetical protein